MSCSKIFLGDLPEITEDIIKFFQNDFSTLYSCILVNRLWCRLAIPFLWENPFSIPTENYNFIEIYLNNLNNDLKSKLNEYNNEKLLPSNTLFDYSSFIKYLNTWSVIFSIESWSETLKPESRYIIRNPDTVSDFKRLISMLLFKLFIENETNLHTFIIEITDYPDCKYYHEDILELMLQNPNFIHNIRNLKLHIMANPNSTTSNKLIKNRISQIINSNQIFKKIILSYNSCPLYQSLLLSNNCSNTLNSIVFYYTNFKDIIDLDDVFEQLNVLESVHVVYCSSLNEFTQQIINVTKPFKLKSLFIAEILQIESLQLLLQISGKYLENFGYGFGYGYELPLKQQLLELIIRYCKNIKFLDLYESENQIIHLTLNLIENIRQNLNHLSFDVCETLFSSGAVKRSSIILQNLGKILPFKLEYLDLTLSVDIIDFKMFLQNSQNTFINKFLINNRGGHDILPCIKENIMKKKRVKYLAIMNTVFDKQDKTFFEDKDLFSLEDEVKEFESYNIKIQRYNCLIIYTNMNFVKELD